MILPHGASMGSGYGPIVVAREPIARERLRELEIAVPGKMTTAFLALRLYLDGEYRYREVPFDEILDEVKSGRADAGLLIHEGQLTYASHGLERVVDLGEWWMLETGLPLPLGINVARRDLGAAVLHELSEVLAESIEAGLRRRPQALKYAMKFGRGLDPALTDRFVGMYVNRLTQDYGDEGREAVRGAPRARARRPARSSTRSRSSSSRPQVRLAPPTTRERLPPALVGTTTN